MGEGGRSLRPRGAVDYRNTNGVSKTPGWMPLGKKKPGASPASAQQASDKENAQPLHIRLQSVKQTRKPTSKGSQIEALEPEPGSQAQAEQTAGKAKASKAQPKQAAGKPANGRRSKSKADSLPQPTEQDSAQAAPQDNIQEPATAEQQDSRPSRNKRRAGKAGSDLQTTEGGPAQPAASERSSRSKSAAEADHTGPTAPPGDESTEQPPVAQHKAGDAKQKAAAGKAAKPAAAPAANQRKRTANPQQPVPASSQADPQAQTSSLPSAPSGAPAETAPLQPAEQAAPKRRKLTSKAAQRKQPAAAKPDEPVPVPDSLLDAAQLPQPAQTTAAQPPAQKAQPTQQAPNAGGQQGHAEDLPQPGPHFMSLKADYASLLQQYQELKDTSIAGLEGMLVEHTSKEREVAESAQALAAHWEQEAARQAARAQIATTLHQQVSELQEQILDLEGRLLQEEIKRLGDKETIMDLEHKVTSAAAAVPQVQSRPPPTPGAQSVQGDHAALEDLEACGQLDQIAGYGEATPAAERDQPADVLDEERETPALPVPMTGLVACRSSAKPLVPYSNTHAAGLLVHRVSGPQQASHVLSPVPAQQIPILWQNSPPQTPVSQDAGAQTGVPASTQGCLIAHDKQSRWEEWEEEAVATSAAARKDAGDISPAGGQADGHPNLPGPMPQPQRLSLTLSPAPKDPSEQRSDSQALLNQPQPPLSKPARQDSEPRKGARSGASSASKQPADTEVRLGGQMRDVSSGNRTHVDSADVTSQQAVALLSGLEAIPSGEGFHFRHEASGYTFQLAPAPASPGSSAESMRQAELAYLPIRLGAAAQVLPDYLRYEIRCGEAQRQRLMGRIMEALACWAPGMQTAA